MIVAELQRSRSFSSEPQCLRLVQCHPRGGRRKPATLIEAVCIDFAGIEAARTQVGIAVRDARALGHAVEHRLRFRIRQQGARKLHEVGVHVVIGYRRADAIDVRSRHAAVRKASTALKPPNANEFDNAAPIGRRRAVFGT